MRLAGRVRSAVGWALFGAVVGGAAVPHSHPIIAGGDEGGGPSAAASSARVITDDSSNNLRWHSVIRVEQDDCLACHAQRTSDLSRPVVVQFAAPVPVPLPAVADVRGLLRTLSPNSSRAPPALL